LLLALLTSRFTMLNTERRRAMMLKVLMLELAEENDGLKGTVKPDLNGLGPCDILGTHAQERVLFVFFCHGITTVYHALRAFYFTKPRRFLHSGF
jgi:hypothetical protein